MILSMGTNWKLNGSVFIKISNRWALYKLRTTGLSLILMAITIPLFASAYASRDVASEHLQKQCSHLFLDTATKRGVLDTIPLDNKTYQGLLTRLFQIRDYSTSIGEMGEPSAEFLDKVDQTGGFFSTVFYPFINEGIPRSLWSQFKDPKELPNDPVYKRFPFLRSRPTVIPGKDSAEQKVYLAYQLFHQYLFYIEAEQKPLVNLNDDLAKMVKVMAKKPSLFAELNFLSNDDFQKKSNFYNLPDHRWMITELNDLGNPKIFINKDLIAKSTQPYLDDVTYLMGLLAHEYGHIVGFKDESSRALDRLAIAFSVGMRENNSIQQITLPNGRVVSFYIIRTSSLNYSKLSNLVEFGGRVIFDDGHNIHDLSPILSHVVLHPKVKNSKEFFYPHFWGFRSLNISTFVSETTNSFSLTATIETQIKFKHMMNVSQKVTPNSIDFEFEGGKHSLTEAEPFTVRLALELSKDPASQELLLVKGVDGLPVTLKPTSQDAKGPEQPFGPSVKPMTLPVTMTPYFTNEKTQAGSTLSLMYILKVPKDQTQLLNEISQGKLVLAPTLSTVSGRVYETDSLYSLVPKEVAFRGYLPMAPSDPNYSLLIEYNFETHDRMKSKKLYADKVIVQKNKQSIGYFMTERNPDKNWSSVFVQGRYDKDVVQFKVIPYNKENAVFVEVESPTQLTDIVGEFVIDYEDALGHKFQQPFKARLYHDGRVRPNSDELSMELISHSKRMVQLKLQAKKHFSADVDLVKVYKLNKLHVLAEFQEITDIPVDLNLIHK